MSRYLDLAYWFSMNPGSEFGGLYMVLIFCTSLLILALILTLVIFLFKPSNKVLKGFLKKLRSRLYIYMIVGYLLAFARYEGAYLLSMRFWWMIYGLLFLYHLVQTVLDFAKRYPHALHVANERERAKRYRP